MKKEHPHWAINRYAGRRHRETRYYESEPQARAHFKHAQPTPGESLHLMQEGPQFHWTERARKGVN